MAYIWVKNSTITARMAAKDIQRYKFKNGQSGNPSGRPKKLPEVDRLLADVLSAETDGITAAEMVIRKLLDMALKGNLRAAEVLLDRAYGKPKQRSEVTPAQQGEIKNVIIEIPNNPLLFGEAPQDTPPG